ncbi:MAG: TolC family protein [Epsilonproteobacteria bacterium]|nr:TolC family protein [Campylobacterota bacterium]
MKKTAFLIPVFLFANQNILSDLKLKLLNLDKQRSIYSAKETQKSWINPIILQYSISQNNSLHTTKQNIQTFSVSINQPIFKTGAIYYSIKYAKNLKNYNLKQIELQKRALIKQAYELVYDYKINKLNEEIALLNIQNAKIDVKKKKEDFLNGTGDSTFLNQAIINLNNIKLGYEDLKFNEKQLKFSFKNLSDLDIEKVKLPYFKIISKNDFINNNLQLISSKINDKIKYDLYKMQLGNQLLTISFNASYNYQNTDYTDNTPQYRDDTNNYYNVGLSVTLPIDVTSTDKVKQTKLSYIKSRYETLDTKRNLLNTYAMIISQIKTLQKKKEIYKENEKAYANLIESTKESIKAGNATVLDLEILENSYKVMQINQKIIDLQIQKLLLNLYYQVTSKF